MVEILEEVDNDEEITDVRKQVRLIDIDFLDFMPSEDILEMRSKVTDTITLVQFIGLLKEAMAKMLASETGFILANEANYIPSLTLNAQIQLLKSAVDYIF